MANEDKNTQRVNRRIQNIAANVQKNMDDLYRSTYFSSPKAANSIDSITQSINDNIDGIVSRNMNTTGMPSISVLYSRIFSKSGNTPVENLGNNKIINGIQSMFEDPMMMDDLYSTFMSNRFLKELDDEIDTVCRYFPDLEEALEVKKDSVLSADHFSKDFLTIKFPTDGDNDKLSTRIAEMKKKYDLQRKAEEIYVDSAKYGEKFVYIVPYSTAITRLLATKPQTSLNKPYVRQESVVTESEIYKAAESFAEHFSLTIDNSRCVISDNTSSVQSSKACMMTESVITDRVGNKTTKMVETPILQPNESFKLNIEINNSGIIDSAITEVAQSTRVKKSMPQSLSESFASQVNNGSHIHETNTPQAKGNLNFDNVLKSTVNDGLIASNVKDQDISKYQVKAPGAVVKYLKREFVIPIYIEQSCAGFYYIEFRSKDGMAEMNGFRNLLTDPMVASGSENRVNFNNIDSTRQEETLKYVAGQLSQFIDKKFVNNNQDLSKEIYEILKFNDLYNSPSIDMIKVTFVPPEDIHHCYFTFDEDSHRGISDLAKGMIPAKLYSSMYITNSIGIMTRGQDKRAYYVKQSVDTNIAQTLINVINQIKMGNFGIRQFNSINNVLNITGKFNDYVIPQSQSGESPVTIDVIPGQNYDVHTDLMDILHDMAIDSTGVPNEIIQTRRSVDYAMQLSMSSSKFLRTVYKRQEAYQKYLSRMITCIYNFEYGENVELDVILPPPVFLNMANTNQLITNTKDFVDSIIDVELATEKDEAVKAEYRDRLFMHYIGTHIDISAHKTILDQARLEVKKRQDESQVQSEQPEESGGYGEY